MESNFFDVQGKVVIVTGGAGVLGGSMAKHLLGQGAKVVILSRKQASIDEALSQLQRIGAEVMGLACDVLKQAEVEQAKDQILARFGRIDGLINAAGGNMPGATIGENQTFFELDLADFRKVAELNLDGSVIPCMVFGKVMAEQGSGSIINISSMASDRAITRVVGYSSAKAAIDIFTKWLATEFARKFEGKIRVNAIAPGFFIGKQNRRLLLNEDGSLTERGNLIVRNTPMQRFGEPRELNGAAQFFLSEASTFVTGIVMPVDGGFSAFSGV